MKLQVTEVFALLFVGLDPEYASQLQDKSQTAA